MCGPGGPRRVSRRPRAVRAGLAAARLDCKNDVAFVSENGHLLKRLSEESSARSRSRGQPVRRYLSRFREMSCRYVPYHAMRDPVHVVPRARIFVSQKLERTGRPLARGARSPSASQAHGYFSMREQALHRRVFEPSWIGAYAVFGGFTCASP